MFSSFVLVLSFLGLGTATVGPCTHDWEYMTNRKCYGFGNITVSWGEAMAICRGFNAKLAEVTDAIANKYVSGIAQRNNADHVWLGGSELFHAGDWRWVSTGASFQEFSRWVKPPPTASGGDLCLTMWSRYYYNWAVYPCAEHAMFICEGEPGQ